MFRRKHNSRTIIAPRLDPLQTPGEAKLRRKIKIEKKARRDGVLNLPESGDAALNESQQQIVDHSQEGINAAYQWAVQQFGKCADVLPKTDAGPVDFKLDDIKGTVQFEITRLRAAAKDELITLRLDERRKFREKSAFQQENELSRGARYPESQLFALSLLAVMVVGESVANAYLFAKGNPFGLIGGWLQAFLVSLANVSVSFVFGLFVFRNLHHVQWLRKGVAFALLPVGIIAIFSYNLCIAHYRDLLETNRSLTAIAEALDKFRSTPFHLLNLESVILLILGIVVCIIAAWDGYSVIDDPYPEHGKVDRRYQRTLAQYERRKRALRQDINDVVDSSFEKIEGMISAIQQKLEWSVQLVNHTVVVMQQFKRSVDELTQMSHRLLKTYREVNAKVRTTPAPKYFERFLQLEPQPINPPDAIIQRREWLSDGLARMKSDAGTLRTELQTIIQGELDSLFQFVDEIERTADGKFQKEIRLIGNQSAP